MIKGVGEHYLSILRLLLPLEKSPQRQCLIQGIYAGHFGNVIAESLFNAVQPVFHRALMHMEILGG